MKNEKRFEIKRPDQRAMAKKCFEKKKKMFRSVVAIYKNICIQRYTRRFDSTQHIQGERAAVREYESSKPLTVRQRDTVKNGERERASERKSAFSLHSFIGRP